MKETAGDIFTGNFQMKFAHFERACACSTGVDESSYVSESLQLQQQSCWANMPPELLRDVIQRIEESECTWPSRRNVVACAAVCKTWRAITKETVKTPEQSGKLTFPVSLKQPGPRGTVIQCFIKRNRSTSTYCVYLGLTPTLTENGKLLLTARRFRRATTTDYIISLYADDLPRGSNAHVGKVRANFLGTKFTIYDSQPPYDGAIAATDRAGRRVGVKQVAPRVPAGSYLVAHISYELNVLGTRGPRRMQCTLHSIPVSSMEEGGHVPTPTELSSPFEEPLPSLSLPRCRAAILDCNVVESETLVAGNAKEEPLILKNKSPRWHEQLNCWCLNFQGRVTVASVKNFQLVAAMGSSEHALQTDDESVLLQFGKVGKDTFTMDYQYPLSAFQAFAICLSSFDTKLTCE
eukprot:c25963_g1_i1 orf=135-1355(+)